MASTNIANNQQSSQGRSPFFKLPAEIRKIIFDDAMGIAQCFWDSAHHKSSTNRIHIHIVGDLERQRRDYVCGPKCLSMLWVCKQWHEETTSQLYETIHLKLGPRCRSETLFFNIHPSYLGNVRHLIIQFDSTAYSRPDMDNYCSRKESEPILLSVAERVTDILRLCQQGGLNLQKVTFFAPWHGTKMKPTPIDIALLVYDDSIFSTLSSVSFVNFGFLFPSPFYETNDDVSNWNRPLNKSQQAYIKECLGEGWRQDKGQPLTGCFTMYRHANWGLSTSGLEEFAEHGRQPFRAHTPEFRSLVLQHDLKLRRSGLQATRLKPLTMCPNLNVISQVRNRSQWWNILQSHLEPVETPTNGPFLNIWPDNEEEYYWQSYDETF